MSLDKDAHCGEVNYLCANTDMCISSQCILALSVGEAQVGVKVDSMCAPQVWNRFSNWASRSFNDTNYSPQETVAN